MKTLILAAAVTAMSVLPVFADPVEGMWRTTKDDNGNSGVIQVSQCGSKICGTLVKSFGADGKAMASENIGKKIIWDMVSKGNGVYGDGKIWSPDRDKTYSSKMQMSGNKLAVKGCVFGICRDGGTWTRAN